MSERERGGDLNGAWRRLPSGAKVHGVEVTTTVYRRWIISEVDDMVTYGGTPFRPSYVVLKYINGELSSIDVGGPRVLKHGGTSARSMHTHWWAVSMLAETPRWLRELVEAPS